MSAEDTTGPDIAALRRLLDTYGGDASRWPQAEARRVAPLLARDGPARALLAEARALDKILARAPITQPERRQRLADRIAAAANVETDTATMRRGPNVLDLTRASGPARRAPIVRRAGQWQAAALLAASLLVGVFAGVSGIVGPAFDDVAALLGLAGDGDTLITALEYGIDSAIDEETL